MIGRFIGTVRRNHALEHATVSLLISRLGPDLRLVGRATGDGFFIYGDLPTDTLTDCVHEGLRRLKRGEAFWAVTPLCGTNLATAGILAGLSSFATMGGGGDRKDRLPNVIMGGIIAVIAAQPLGRIIQRYITTSPDLSDTEVLGIDVNSTGSRHKVRTRRSPRPVVLAV